MPRRPGAQGDRPGALESVAMLNRRLFLEEASLASLLATFAPAARAAVEGLAAGTPSRLIPKALGKGATVALVSPASPGADADSLEAAKEIAISFGLVPKVFPHAGDRTMYLAGRDADRAADVNAAFLDSSVDAVWCTRGGYGSSRLLPLLDYGAIRKNPKPLIGFSDITALLNAVNRLTGLVTFHGPTAGENQGEFTLQAFKRVLFEAKAAGVVGQAAWVPAVEGRTDKQNRLRRISPGKARGPLAGGNISVFSELIGTPFEPDLKGRILFLEEVGEEPYRIDRWLTGFLLTGKLSGCAGIVLGKFKDCGAREFQPSFNGTWTWQEVAADRLGALGIPVLAGVSFGHGPENATLPIGIEAELDVAAGTLSLLEPAVA